MIATFRRVHRLITFSEASWFRLTLLLWLGLLSYHNSSLFLPSSYWMTLNDVHVYDAPVGTWPKMDVDQTIKRPVTADWFVEVEQRVDDGWVNVPDCTSAARNDYSPMNRLPGNLDLGWWMLYNKCFLELPRGTYRVATTRLSVVPPGKRWQKDSNEFKLF
jgi:hypothetical protein